MSQSVPYEQLLSVPSICLLYHRLTQPREMQECTRASTACMGALFIHISRTYYLLIHRSALLIYEFLLTVQEDAQVFRQQRLTATSFVLFMNRLTLALQFLEEIVSYFVPVSSAVRSHHIFNPSLRLSSLCAEVIASPLPRKGSQLNAVSSAVKPSPA